MGSSKTLILGGGLRSLILFLLLWSSTSLSFSGQKPGVTEDEGILSQEPNTDVGAQPGPHGELILPQGGKKIRSVDGLGLLSIKYAKWKDDSVETISIDLTLKPLKNGNGKYLLATGLTSPRDEKHIVALFNAKWACGSYKLVVREHQYYEGVHISFQAAAPTIKITCLPIQR